MTESTTNKSNGSAVQGDRPPHDSRASHNSKPSQGSNPNEGSNPKERSNPKEGSDANEGLASEHPTPRRESLPWLLATLQRGRVEAAAAKSGGHHTIPPSE